MIKLLTKSSTLWRSFGSGKLGAIAEQGAISATSLLVSVLIGRTCGTETLGTYSLAWTIVTLLNGFVSSLVGIPYTIRFNQRKGDEDDASKYRGASLLNLFSLAVLCLLGLLIGAATISSRDLRNVILVTACICPVVMLRDTNRRWSFAEARISRALETTLLAAFLQIFLLLLLTVTGHLNATNAMLGLGVSYAIAVAVWFASYEESIHFERTNSTRSVLADWRLGRWIVAHQAAAICHVYCILWLCNSLLPSETGVLAALVTLSSVGNPLIIGLSNVYTPMFAAVSADRNLTKRAFRMAMISFSVAMAIFSICYAVLGKHIALFLYRFPELDLHHMAFAILGLRLFLASLGSSSHLLFISNHVPVKSVISVTAGLIITCATAAPLTSMFQLNGLLCAWLLGMAVETAFFLGQAMIQLSGDVRRPVSPKTRTRNHQPSNVRVR